MSLFDCSTSKKPCWLATAEHDPFDLDHWGWGAVRDLVGRFFEFSLLKPKYEISHVFLWIRGIELIKMLFILNETERCMFRILKSFQLYFMELDSLYLTFIPTPWYHLEKLKFWTSWKRLLGRIRTSSKIQAFNGFCTKFSFPRFKHSDFPFYFRGRFVEGPTSTTLRNLISRIR